MFNYYKSVIFSSDMSQSTSSSIRYNNHYEDSDSLDFYDSNSGYDSDTVSISSSIIESMEIDLDNDERIHDENPIKDKQHCIGLYVIQLDGNLNVSDMLLVIRISSILFYKYPTPELENYLTSFYSFDASGQESIIVQNLDIIQIRYDFGTSVTSTSDINIDVEPRYQVVVKTIWLKLIQREWRKHLQKMKKNTQYIIFKRGLPNSQRYFEIRGKYPFGLNECPRPTLKGLMYQYSQTHRK